MRLASRNLCLTACALLALSLAPACGVHDSSVIETSGKFGATPPGPSAVLIVTARPAAKPKTLQRAWGVVNTLNAEKSFAEILAHAAREDGGMAVILPFEVSERIEKAKLTPTLQPTPEDLRKFAQLLGCASYLTADVTTWRYGYVYFSSYATVAYTIACHRADDDSVVWEADVQREARDMSDREVARLALSEAFRKLKASTPRAGPSPPEAAVE